MLIRERVTITGRVQGVGLRRRAARLAKEANITGWVRNCEKGDMVELEVQGEDSNIRYMLGVLEDHATFRDVVKKRMELEDEYDFRIVR